MNLATRAALFNVLLFPGCGQIYLKKYKRGFLIITGVVIGILSIIWSIIQSTINILRVAPFKKGTVTLSAVVQLTIDSIKALNMSYLFLILLSMILLLIISILDAYLLGKKEMAKINMPVDQESASPPA
jgi:TM2 domain-containing membrane protein YozV